MTDPHSPFVPLLDGLPANAELFWQQANRRLLWGWKRDLGGDSRLVFYAARLARDGEVVGVCDQHMLYIHRTHGAIAQEIQRTFERGRAGIEETVGRLTTSLRRARAGQLVVEASIGAAGPQERALTTKLRRRRPRRAIAEVPDVTPTELTELDALFPADLYVGSGMSYEAGLPTLCDMHEAFCVDDPTGTRFATGRDDRLPADLATAPRETIARFGARRARGRSNPEPERRTRQSRPSPSTGAGPRCPRGSRTCRT